MKGPLVKSPRGLSRATDDALAVKHFASCNCAYVYDGTFEGLLSAVFLAFERHEVPDDMVSADIYQPRLGQEEVVVQTDIQHALRVRRGIERVAGNAAFRVMLAASLTDSYDAGIAVFHFILYLMYSPQFKRERGALSDMANPAVARIVQLKTRAYNEAEKMRQFVRFSHLENGVWFARINPNVSVIPLVMGHFAGRFNDQPFIIYDEVHELSGIYDGVSWQMIKGSVETTENPTEHDQIMEDAWRCFYDALCVDARYNPELRRNFMPKRFWKNLPEMMPYNLTKDNSESIGGSHGQAKGLFYERADS